MDRRNISRRRMWILTFLSVLTLLFIWENSLKAIPDSSDRSQWVAQWLQRIFGEGETVRWMVRHIRKVAHFIEYAVLGVLGALILQTAGLGRSVHYILHLLFFCLLAAVLDEALQVVSNRGSKATDVLLDFGGALAGAGLCLMMGNLLAFLLGKKK